MLKIILDKIKEPFISIAVIYDESKRIDENGDWERHYNKKEERRKKKREAHKKELLFSKSKRGIL